MQCNDIYGENADYSKQILINAKNRLEGAGWYNVRIALSENSPVKTCNWVDS